MDRVPPPGSRIIAGQTLEQQLAILEKRLATLESMLQAAPDGSLAIKAVKISLQAPNVEVKAASTLKLEASANATFKCGGSMDIAASGTASVKAAMLSLNGGSKPIARQGDSMTPAGTIQTGNPTVLG
jgi:uncharacterized Zn-binding protein involved in type VI secretion